MFSIIVLSTAVLIAACIDMRTGRIPNALTAILALLCLGDSIIHGTIVSALLGAAATAGPLLVLHVASRGRGLGLGDVKLAVGIGLALGALAGITAIGIAFIAGAMFCLAALAAGRIQRKARIAFGPFLAIGTLVVMMTHVQKVIIP